MNRVVNAFIAAAVVGWTLLAEAHEVGVVLYPTIGPVSVPGIVVSQSFAAFAANTLLALQSGRRDAGGSILVNPTAFNTIGPRIANKSGRVMVSAFDMYATQGTSWRGLPAHGAFANERGTHYRTAVAITSHTPFTLADVIMSKTYSDYPDVIRFPLGGPLGKAPYQAFDSERLLGISWGPDGSPGGGDDTRYNVNNPGSYTTPVNEILFVGLGDLDYASPTDPNSDARQFAAYLDYLKDHSPYTFTHTYGLRGVSSTVDVAVDLTRRGTHPPLPHRPLRPFRPFMDR